jgi:hypothetical protein
MCPIFIYKKLASQISDADFHIQKRSIHGLQTKIVYKSGFSMWFTEATAASPSRSSKQWAPKFFGRVVFLSGHAIDGEFLQANFEEAEQSLEKSRQGWDRYGVTIMCDSWTGPTGMAIINFMVSCNGLMFFHKSIDASSCKQSAGKCSCTKCNCHLSSSFT